MTPFPLQRTVNSYQAHGQRKPLRIEKARSTSSFASTMVSSPYIETTTTLRPTGLILGSGLRCCVVGLQAAGPPGVTAWSRTGLPVPAAVGCADPHANCHYHDVGTGDHAVSGMGSGTRPGSGRLSGSNGPRPKPGEATGEGSMDVPSGWFEAAKGKEVEVVLTGQQGPITGILESVGASSLELRDGLDDVWVSLSAVVSIRVHSRKPPVRGVDSKRSVTSELDTREVAALGIVRTEADRRAFADCGGVGRARVVPAPANPVCRRPPGTPRHRGRRPARTDLRLTARGNA